MSSGRRVCPPCNKPVNEDSNLEHAGRLFHAECWKCTTCGGSFSPIPPYRWFDKFLCKRCILDVCPVPYRIRADLAKDVFYEFTCSDLADLEIQVKSKIKGDWGLAFFKDGEMVTNLSDGMSVQVKARKLKESPTASPELVRRPSLRDQMKQQMSDMGARLPTAEATSSLDKQRKGTVGNGNGKEELISDIMKMDARPKSPREKHAKLSVDQLKSPPPPRRSKSHTTAGKAKEGTPKMEDLSRDFGDLLTELDDLKISPSTEQQKRRSLEETSPQKNERMRKSAVPLSKAQTMQELVAGGLYDKDSTSPAVQDFLSSLDSAEKRSASARPARKALDSYVSSKPRLSNDKRQLRKGHSEIKGRTSVGTGVRRGLARSETNESIASLRRRLDTDFDDNQQEMNVATLNPKAYDLLEKLGEVNPGDAKNTLFELYQIRMFAEELPNSAVTIHIRLTGDKGQTAIIPVRTPAADLVASQQREPGDKSLLVEEYVTLARDVGVLTSVQVSYDNPVRQQGWRLRTITVTNTEAGYTSDWAPVSPISPEQAGLISRPLTEFETHFGSLEMGKVILRPILRFSGMRGGTMHISALLVTKGAREMRDLRYRFGVPLQKRQTKPKELAIFSHQFRIWRYDMYVELTDEEQTVTYYPASGLGFLETSFRVPARGVAPTIVCSSDVAANMDGAKDDELLTQHFLFDYLGQTLHPEGKEKEKEKDKDKKSGDYPHLFFVAGGHLSTQGVLTMSAAAREFNGLRRSDRLTSAVPSLLQHDLELFYFLCYCLSWNQKSVQKVFSSVPTVMTWDSSDIFPGWDRLSNIERTAPLYQTLYNAAKLAFFLFQQHGLSNRLLRRPDKSSAKQGTFSQVPRLRSLTSVHSFNNISIVVLDVVSEANNEEGGTALSRRTWEKLASWLQSLVQNQHLFLVTPTPILFPRLGTKLDAAYLEQYPNFFMRISNYWSNPEELQFLLDLLTRNSERNGYGVTILSGSATVGCAGTVSDRRTGTTLRQIVASPLVAQPPPHDVLRNLELRATLQYKVSTFAISIERMPAKEGNNRPVFCRNQNYVVLVPSALSGRNYRPIWHVKPGQKQLMKRDKLRKKLPPPDILVGDNN